MEQIEDIDLGTIQIIRNARAKRIIVRKRDDMFILTTPTFISLAEIETAISKLKPKLANLPSKNRYAYKVGETLETLTFSLRISQSPYSNLYHGLKDGILNIVIPETAEIEDHSIQNQIQNIVELYLRHGAKKTLPLLVEKLATKHNFSYTSVSIQKSRTRWGSCSSSKKINLSYWCMLLPRHLVEFIILHELCHTIEMNHGANFWALLDHVTNGKAQELTSELRSHKIKL